MFRLSGFTLDTLPSWYLYSGQFTFKNRLVKTCFKQGAVYEPVKQGWGCCRSTLQAFIGWIHREDYMKIVHHLEIKHCQSQNMLALNLDVI